MCRHPPHVVIADFFMELLFVAIGVPIRTVESYLVASPLQFLVISLVNDWPSAIAGFIYGFVASNMFLLPLAHYFVMQSSGLCTFYVSWVMWVVGQLAHAFVSYLRDVPGVQQSCITNSALCHRWRLRKPSHVGYTGMLVGLLFASPIATPVLPGLDPVTDRIQFCQPVLGCPLWALATTVCLASFITARVFISLVVVPTCAGQERLPIEDAALEMETTAMRSDDGAQLELLGEHERAWGGLISERAMAADAKSQ